MLSLRYLDIKVTWIFRVPGRYRELKNSVLILEHPHYTLNSVDLGQLVINVPDDKIIAIENFPKKNGRYKIDEKTAIPIDIPDNKGRYLYRADERIGPIGRGCDPRGIANDNFIINALYKPSSEFGILTTEIKELTEEANKIEKV
jgi:hypothetical protein